MIHHTSFWPEARRTGGIYLHDENSEGMRKMTNKNVAKEKFTKGKTKVRKEKNSRKEEENATKKTVMEITAARNNMLILLEQMRQKGVKLFVDGEAALPGEIASKAVCEGSTYMADYVLGENGFIEQVRFDKVTGQ